MADIDQLVEEARLLGAVQAKKGFGAYSQEDALTEGILYKRIDDLTQRINDETKRLEEAHAHQHAVAGLMLREAERLERELVAVYKKLYRHEK
jgi:Mg2+ and Co2+ transporter CorA